MFPYHTQKPAWYVYLQHSPSEPDSEPAESESTAAPTSTTVNASAGTVPSNIPTTATSEAAAAAAAATSNETSLPIEVTRQAAPNQRTLREINNLLIEMRNILYRGMLPIEVIF